MAARRLAGSNDSRLEGFSRDTYLASVPPLDPRITSLSLKVPLARLWWNGDARASTHSYRSGDTVYSMRGLENSTSDVPLEFTSLRGQRLKMKSLIEPFIAIIAIFLPFYFR